MKKRKPSFETAAKDAAEDFLGDGDDETVEFKVSEQYAKKYNERKDREELSKNKKVLEQEGSSSDSASSEDEGAELLTSKVENKIFQTLQKIKSKDPTIYNDKHVFFDDKDFQESKTPSTGSKSSAIGSEKKGVKYKDFLRNTLLREGADALVREEEEMERKSKRRTPNEEQADLKASILKAAHAEENEDDDDDLFTLKEKTADEVAKEDEEFEQFMQSKHGQRDADGEEIISRYWKADEDLDSNEQFLRDFVLNKGWLDTGSLQSTGTGSMRRFDDEVDSSEDEEHLEEADEFEKEYNFRFETEEGGKIQGHARFQEASVRERSDKRKRQRQEKAERKEGEKIRRIEELKRLKNLKKQEIMRRLKQLQDVTGNQETALGAIDLDADFNPDTHDTDMGNMLGQDYDNQDEDLTAEELTQAPSGIADLDVSGDGASVPAAAKRGLMAAGRNSAAAVEEGGDDGGDNAEAEAEEDEADEEVDDQTWWLCDMCQKGIPGGKKRFDCSICDNYTLCIKCFRVRKHPHQFVRKRVPEAAMPPADFKRREADGENMQEVLDEYFQLDYEDIIGGDLPTRFKYRKVEANAYGLSPEELLSKSDKELNRVVPLKKLRTYRDDVGQSIEDDSGKGLGKGRFAGRGGGRGDGRGRGAARLHGQKKATGSGSGNSSGGKSKLSGSRLAAYNLQADRGPTRNRKKDKEENE